MYAKAESRYQFEIALYFDLSYERSRTYKRDKFVAIAVSAMARIDAAVANNDGGKSRSFTYGRERQTEKEREGERNNGAPGEDRPIYAILRYSRGPRTPCTIIALSPASVSASLTLLARSRDHFSRSFST